MRAEVETDRAVPSTQSRETRYRPALDGLRAVAVYLVVAFHAGLSAFDGGFVDATHLTATFATLLALQKRAVLDDARALEQRRG